jgi:hypothetical protein
MLAWWLKPLYEPPLLFWMSRAMFDDRPDPRGLRDDWWRIVGPQLIANLTWRRLSPNRSFYMPVAVLEGLHGKARQARLAVLGRRQQVGIWLTFVGVAIEIALEFSATVLIVIMIPEELRWLDLSDVFLAQGRTEEVLQNFSNLLAMSVIAPFYVAGGFGLYLTRRSQLEGWDIELGFRRLAARRRQTRGGMSAAAAVLLAVACLVHIPRDALAVGVPERDQARTLITEILAEDDFGEKRTETYWKYVGKKQNEEDDLEGWEWLVDWLVDVFSGFFKGIAQIGEALLWAAVGLVLAGMIWWLLRNRVWLPGLSGRSGESPQAAVTLFGLDVRPESLPEDIAATARTLLEQGDPRGALSLLYRGLLAKFIEQGYPQIPDSATEGECLLCVRKTRSKRESDYFRALTEAWIRLAYGHLVPSREQVQQLCDNWQVADEP